MDDSHDTSIELEGSLHTQLGHFTTSGQWHRARDTAAILLAKSPDSAWLHLQMGYLLYMLDVYKGSESHYKKALSLAPEDPAAYRGLAYLYLDMGRAGAAEENVRKTLSLDPLNDSAWALLAHLTLHFDDVNNALTYAEKSLELAPDNHFARDVYIRAKGQLRSNEGIPPQQQIQEYEQILAENPECVTSHSRIATLYLDELKDTAKAEQHFRIALAISPDNKNCQQGLIKSLRRRDPFLRVLYLPWSCTQAVFKLIKRISDIANTKVSIKNILILLACFPLIFFIKPLIIVAALGFLIFISIFWPMAKAYEYLTIAEIYKKMGKLTYFSGPLQIVHKLPFLVRFTIFIALLTLFWGLIVLLLSDVKTRATVWTFMLTIAVILFLFIGITGLIYDLYERITIRRRNRKNKNLLNQ